ncbi:hypothetical protein PC116_g25085 [Phytophthora cactorum]|uniref:Uncharacterized protein n=1 Tax=Phytophthora cactorum TaxID=29920 RepID=A0A8T1B6Y9_9STRA|nr:hypothetical protein PC114_g23204 [Phytophthora cactorum]KAG2896673.1 hypothetical protein PC117_g22945 [Phytophthora cactorum]KAG2974128.1 hypothetical protein PC119_g22742 [Phytophthora cactorum]KAG3165968.1 hypothetical protein PC128_g19821 [Phytophthora cactorum]KAG3193344.1 hypothetical protein C6341_g237 [Phytophthora cactorum]
MARGMLDVLTALPHDQIDPLGTEYVIERIQSSLAERDIPYSGKNGSFFGHIFDAFGSRLFHLGFGMFMVSTARLSIAPTIP